MHICEQSHCGCRVYEKNIPIDYQTAVQAEEFNMNLTTCAMNGGEDYELLFTVPIGDHDKIEDMEGVRQIGYITKENLGKFLITTRWTGIRTESTGLESAERLILQAKRIFS